jgi:hypothetical protein
VFIALEKPTGKQCYRVDDCEQSQNENLVHSIFVAKIHCRYICWSKKMKDNFWVFTVSLSFHESFGSSFGSKMPPMIFAFQLYNTLFFIFSRNFKFWVQTYLFLDLELREKVPSNFCYIHRKKLLVGVAHNFTYHNTELLYLA